MIITKRPDRLYYKGVAYKPCDDHTKPCRECHVREDNGWSCKRGYCPFLFSRIDTRCADEWFVWERVQ